MTMTMMVKLFKTAIYQVVVMIMMTARPQKLVLSKENGEPLTSLFYDSV